MIQTVVMLQVSNRSRWSVAMGKQFGSCWECRDLVGGFTYLFFSTIFPMINIESLTHIFRGLKPPFSFLDLVFVKVSLKDVQAHRPHTAFVPWSSVLSITFATCSCYQPIPPGIPPVHSRYPHYPLLHSAGALTAVFCLVHPIISIFVLVCESIDSCVVCHAPCWFRTCVCVKSYRWEIKPMNWSSQAQILELP